MKPLAAGERDRLLAPFARAPRLALAVSGGADSLALLALVDGWRRKRGRPDVVVLTVDHRLRPGSRREAAMVKAVAEARGLPAEILTRRGERPAGDIENAARRARYRLLVAAARRAGASHLLVAHQQDDVAETFLLRLKRGAGVFGLAAMRPEIVLDDGLVIARPLLSVPRARLAATARAASLSPVEDPMNSDPRFVRVRVRKLMPVLAGAGLDAAEIAATAVRLAATADAIDGAVDWLHRASLSIDVLAVARLDPAAFRAAPLDVQLRSIARLLQGIGGDDYPPRFDRLDALRRSLVAETGGKRFKRTLAGTVVEARAGAFLFYREIGRSGLEDMPLSPGFRGVWDHRFAVSAGPELPRGMVLGALGEADRRALKPRLATDAPPAAVAALPALRRHGRLVAVPPLGFGPLPAGVSVVEIVSRRLARPPLFPEFP